VTPRLLLHSTPRGVAQGGNGGLEFGDLLLKRFKALGEW
jgi:hypothetical protein